MNIIQAAPPVLPTRKKISFRRSYRDLFERLKRNEGVWFAVDPKDVSGETPSRKQTILYLSADLRKMKVQTTYQDGMLFVRTVTTEVNREEAAHA